MTERISYLALDSGMKLICFLGKTAYRIFKGQKKLPVDFGWQKKEKRYKIFVAMFPTGRGTNQEKLLLLKKLKQSLVT